MTGTITQVPVITRTPGLEAPARLSHRVPSHVFLSPLLPIPYMIEKLLFPYANHSSFSL